MQPIFPELDQVVAGVRQLAALLCGKDGPPVCVLLVVVVVVAVVLLRRWLAASAAPAAPVDVLPVAELHDDGPVVDVLDDQVAEVLGAVTEGASHRYPDVHPAEALDRYVHDLQSVNYYQRDEKRKKEKAEREKAELAAREKAELREYDAADFNPFVG